MISQTRRKFLGSAAALAAAPFIAQVSNALMRKDAVAADPSSGELNVIFHGVFVFMYNENDPSVITVYGPPVDDHSHVYRAGNWEQEDENVLSPGQQCDLIGSFRDGGAPPTEDETTFPVIECAYPPDGSQAACTIRVPLPHKIVGLRALPKIDAHSDFFSGGYAPLHVNSLPLAYAYVYKYDATQTRPRLACTSWMAPHRPGPVNLHILGERTTAIALPGQHQGFKAIQKFLGYDPSDLDLSLKYADCEIGPDLFPRVKGVLPEEEYFIPELFPNQPQYLPGSPMKCPSSHSLLQPANCSSIHGIVYSKNQK